MKISLPHIIGTLLTLLFAGSWAVAQQPELGDCLTRPTVIQDELYVDNIRWCIEGVVDDPTIEPMAFTALEVGDDGTLYATRPLTGQIMAVRDTDGDLFADTMELFVDGLTLPNGLHFHDGELYVSGGAYIYRMSHDGDVTIITDDLPTGAGFWTGGLTISEDNRLYVTIGAPCDNCDFDTSQRGLILSMELDGSDQQVVATGFRNPADIEFYRDKLWTLDTSPREYLAQAYDELNIVTEGGWYGFPYCLGNDQVNILADSINCDDMIKPTLAFGSGATPISMAAYPYDTLPGTADTLIVVLKGEPTAVDFYGYKVVMINFDEDNQPLGLTLLIPFRKDSGKQAYEPYDGLGYFTRHIVTLSEQGWGIYPEQPLAVAVNSSGWIYLSITGGQIVALRPVHAFPEPPENIYPLWTPMDPTYDPDVCNSPDVCG